MRIIDSSEVMRVVRKLCIEANCRLPDDVKLCIEKSRELETWPAAKDILDKIIENYKIAEEREVPICQDTGMACVFLEIGSGVHIDGDLGAAVDAGVRSAYNDGFLRKSVVGDPLERKNTGDNTPAMLYIDFVAGDSLKVTVAPKGFGSENMSRVKMLS